ncbi:MAG: MmcB family DNA repair protein [Hyphomicrobium sp.]|nr:MmcB family DNA repair protein [Hyphomicrobium sp.]
MPSTSIRTSDDSTPTSDPANRSVTPAPSSGRDVAPEIRRGVIRLLIAHGLAPQIEVPLPDGRRADVMAVSKDGTISIVEIKSSIEDFRADQKWPDYRASCDRLLFAVRPDFPAEILPSDCGLILADRYGGEIVRDAPHEPLTAARRKALLLRLARTASVRLASLLDPALGLEPDAFDV